MLDPIQIDVTVPIGLEQAFDAFVLRINDWWPMASHSMRNGAVSLEPKLGGYIIETAPDGEKFTWGHVTRWDRPNMMELAWYVGRTVETATQVTVKFDGEEGRTRVTLTHTGWDALGDTAAEVRARYGSGWQVVFGEHFGNFVSQLQEAG